MVHEELTAIGPEHNIIFVRIISTLEEIEKQMAGADVNVPRISPVR